MTHTPGPWSLSTVPTQVGHCHRIGPFPSTSQIHPQTHACIYVDGLGLRPEDAPELLANARLIAAAPDLLEAAKRALTFLQDNGMSHGADLARAIAKAEERS